MHATTPQILDERRGRFSADFRENRPANKGP